MKNFNSFSTLVNFVVNPYRRMQKAAGVFALVDYYSEVRKRRENLAVVKKALTKSGSSVGIIGTDIVQHFLKVT